MKKTYNIQIIDEYGWLDVKEKVDSFLDELIATPHLDITFNVRREKELEK